MRKQKQPVSGKKKSSSRDRQDAAPDARSEETPQAAPSPDTEEKAEEKPDAGAAEEPDAGGNGRTESPEKLSEENEQLRDRMLRLQADFDNFRKRQLRERTETVRRATEHLMLELLPVCDHLEMALEAAERQNDPLAEGVKLVFEQLRQVLERASLQAVEADGVEFDPNLHEAVAHIPSEEVPENHIIQQTRRGYRLGEKLLRPAQVVVSSGSSGSGEEEAGAENPKPAENSANRPAKQEA